MGHVGQLVAALVGPLVRLLEASDHVSVQATLCVPMFTIRFAKDNCGCLWVLVTAEAAEAAPCLTNSGLDFCVPTVRTLTCTAKSSCGYSSIRTFNWTTVLVPANMHESPFTAGACLPLGGDMPCFCCSVGLFSG